MKFLQSATYLSLTSLVLVAMGCGGGTGLPDGDTGTVSGLVKYKDKPVPEGCVVTFMQSEKGYTAIGVTNASGEYALKMRDGNQIVAGPYRVSVSPPPEPKSNLTDEEIMEQSMKTQNNPPPKKEALFPEKFSSPESTPLKFDVKAGANDIPIDMKE